MQQHLAARRVQQQPFHLFNANCGAFLAQNHTKNTAILLERAGDAWTTPHLRLYTPIIKQKNLTLLFAKATELGVTEFQPVTFQHTQVTAINTTRLEGVCKEAVEQCERFTLPTVLPPRSLKQCLEAATQPILVALERTNGTAGTKPHTNVLVGPEGGFSAEEKHIIEQHPLCHTFSLGRAILRAETAAICSVYHATALQSFKDGAL